MTTSSLRGISLLVAAGALSIASIGWGSSASAKGKPEANSVERVRPYVQPAVVAVRTAYSGTVYDNFVEEYVGEDEFVVSPKDARVFEFEGFCTGYVVSSTGHIATAGHCVDPDLGGEDVLEAGVKYARDSGFYADPERTVEQLIDTQGYEVRNGDRGSSGISQSFEVAWDVSTGDVESGTLYPARVLDFTSFEKGDGALLKAEVEGVLAVPLSGAGIEVGTEIVAIGYPYSVEQNFDSDLKPSFNDGKVSSEVTAGGLFKAYELSARINGGMSGGPVADAAGEIIGFNSLNLLDDNPISYARPISFITELMKGEGVDNTLNDTSQSFKAGLDAYFAGDKAAAVKNLTKVTEVDKDNDVAGEFLKKATALEDGRNWALLVAAPLVVAAMVVAALIVWRRRTRQEPAVASAFATPPAGPASSGSTSVSEPRSTSDPEAVTTPPGAGRYCTSCGTSAASGQKFCSSCGSALPTE